MNEIIVRDLRVRLPYFHNLLGNLRKTFGPKNTFTLTYQEFVGICERVLWLAEQRKRRRPVASEKVLRSEYQAACERLKDIKARIEVLAVALLPREELLS